jgi:hypothetical protein
MKFVRLLALLLPVLFAVAATVGVLSFTGCEEADDVSALTIEPAFVDLSKVAVTNQTNFTLTFSVAEKDLRDLSLPLRWAVTDSSLGTIAVQSGRSAAYVVRWLDPDDENGWVHGVNAITVVDQYGARGTATILQ